MLKQNQDFLMSLSNRTASNKTDHKQQQADALKSLISAFTSALEEILKATVYMPNFLTNSCKTIPYFTDVQIECFKEILRKIQSGKIDEMESLIKIQLSPILRGTEDCYLFREYNLEHMNSTFGVEEISKARKSFNDISGLLRNHISSLTASLTQYLNDRSSHAKANMMETEKSFSLIKSVQTGNQNIFKLILPRCNQAEVQHALAILQDTNIHAENTDNSYASFVKNIIDQLEYLQNQEVREILSL